MPPLWDPAATASTHLAWAVPQRHPHRVAGRAADVDAILMNAGGEVETIRLRKNVPLNKHRVRQGALTENPVEQRDHSRIDTEAMQGLVRPEAAKHGHIAWLRILAGGSRIGDTDGNRRVRGQPSALHRLTQKSGTHIEDHLSWQQAAQEQITVLSQSDPQGFPVVQVFGRVL